MRAEVLTPLGMEHASFVWSEDFDPPVPNGYDLNGAPIPVYVYPDKAAGGLFARVEDIAKFVSAGMTRFNDAGRRALDPATIEQLYSPVVERPGVYHLAFDAYGLGHFIEWLPSGQKAVSHGGQGSGWMTHFHAVPETGDAIILLTNSQRSWPFFGYLLNDWATWRGFGAVGMGKIVLGTRILWVVIGLLLGLSTWQVWRLIRGLIAGDRRLAPLARSGRFLRLWQGCLVLFLIFILWWTANQDYLFIASVFPVAYGWLGIATACLAGALLLLVLLPGLSTTEQKKQRRSYSNTADPGVRPERENADD